MSLIKIKSILDLKSKLLDKSWLSIVIYLARVFKIPNYVLKYLSFFYLKRKLIYILYIWTKLLSCSFFLLLFQVVSIVKKSNDLLRMWICLLITKSYKKPIVTLLGEKVRNFIFFVRFVSWQCWCALVSCGYFVIGNRLELEAKFTPYKPSVVHNTA